MRHSHMLVDETAKYYKQFVKIIYQYFLPVSLMQQKDFALTKVLKLKLHLVQITLFYRVKMTVVKLGVNRTGTRRSTRALPERPVRIRSCPFARPEGPLAENVILQPVCPLIFTACTSLSSSWKKASRSPPTAPGSCSIRSTRSISGRRSRRSGRTSRC